MNPFLRSEYNYDMNEASDASGLKCEDVSLTKQSFAEEADINFIVKRFGLTGQLPMDVKMPTHEDFTNVPTFHEAMNLVTEARQAFMLFPADVRARFGNNPGLMVDFLSDEANREEAIKLGLVVKPTVQEAAAVVTAPAVAAAKP